jgi:hypothetical protein
MVSIYAPNCRTLRNVFFKNVSRFLKEHGIGIPIVGGVTGLILHVSTREQKYVPINIISIRLACVLSFRRQVNSLDKRINDIEKELEQIYIQKAKGAQIRSREKWVELGEKNNSYFLGLEKQRQVRKSILIYFYNI